MRNMKLTEEQVKVLHDALNQGDSMRGLTIKEIREAMPILDMLEKPAKKERTRMPNGVMNEVLFFVSMELSLKQSEYDFCLNKLEASSGWMSVDFGRKVVGLIDYLKEIPAIEDAERK